MLSFTKRHKMKSKEYIKREFKSYLTVIKIISSLCGDTTPVVRLSLKELTHWRLVFPLRIIIP